MLTRLKVSGFKNLVDVDVRFGPFTCIAGANGVGKSNLFDAIRFLSALADRPLVDAAESVRGGFRNLFHRVGSMITQEMSFEAEMLIPSIGRDDLGQPASATSTLLRYKLRLAYTPDGTLPLEVLEERLEPLNRDSLRFPHQRKWVDSISVLSRRRNPYIHTEIDETTGERVVYLHLDGVSGRRPQPLAAHVLPRTVLSVANAATAPTAVLARQEMRSWWTLGLELSALRQPDNVYEVNARLDSEGTHLPATLYRLQQQAGENRVFPELVIELAELLPDVRAVTVDRDEKRGLITLLVMNKDGTWLPATSLSDGTLRFLAFAAMSLDPDTSGVLCIEEPENGLHPRRIPVVVELLQRIAVDVQLPVDQDNPLRQVIVNTHSPLVVQQMPADNLLFAELVENNTSAQGRFKTVQFSNLPDTWRTTEDRSRMVAKGDLLPYVNPVPFAHYESKALQRLIDRDDIQRLLQPLEFEVDFE